MFEKKLILNLFLNMIYQTPRIMSYSSLIELSVDWNSRSLEMRVCVCACDRMAVKSFRPQSYRSCLISVALARQPISDPVTFLGENIPDIRLVN